MVIGEILSVSGAEGRTGAVTDVPDPTEPAPTDLLDFPPLPQQSSGPDAGAGGGTAPPEAIRVVPDAEATARLRITLPTQPPTPSTALRPQSAWEDTHAEETASTTAAFSQTAASPVKPSTLPSQLAAMTTATMVIPLPPSVRPGSGLLTTTLPPDQAALANAAQIGEAFRDTIEEIFGVDLATADPSEVGLAPLEQRRAADSVYEDGYGSGFEPGYGAEEYPDDAYASSDSGYRAEELAAQAFAPVPLPASLPRPVPAAVFGGAYGVPTQHPPLPAQLDSFGQSQRGQADPGRHALALRYLGGIFHDSSGESSYLDPEELDQGWIPSAFGSAPPDAPTEQIARIPALEPPSGAPVGRAVPASAAPTRVAPPASAAEVTAVLPAQSAAAPAPGRSGTGSRGAHGGHRPKPAAEPAGRSAEKRRHTAAAAAEPDHARGGRARTLTILALCLAAVALLYGIALLVAGGVFSGTVPSGVSVDGVSLGGLSPSAARTALSTQLGPVAVKPIELQVGQTPVTLDPAKAGLSLDVAGTVQAAQSERTNPFTVVPALFGVGHQVDPVITVDRTALTTALDALASAYDSQLVEGKIAFANGQPVVTAPRQGRGFDVAAAVNAVASGYLRTGGPIVLPVSALTPLATPEALQAALENLARPAVSGPITIETGGISTVLTPAQIGDLLTIAPDQNGAMVPTVDGAALRAELNPAALATEQPGVNAAFTVVDGEPRLVPEKDGVGYPAQSLANAVVGALTKTGSGRTVTVARGPLPPAFTTADAQALGVQTVLGNSTLAVPAANDRDADTRHAAELVMGSVVQPGAVWSFDKTVGMPISANGFAEPSGTGKDGVDASGADDLVATAVFDAAFRSGMGDTVHHPNAAYASRYPVGLDAAVVYPGTDLQWTNSGSHPVYVYASYANGSLTVDLLGRQAYDEVDVSVSDKQHLVAPTGSAVHGCPAQAASDGFQVDVTRVLMRGGEQVGTEQFHVAYVPFAGTTCGSGGLSGTSSGSGSTGTPSSGSSSTPTGGGSTGSGGGGGSGGGTAPSSPSQPQPSPSTGVLGGLLH